MGAALVRHAGHANAGELRELEREDLLRRAAPDHAVVELAGMLLRVGDEALPVSGRHLVRGDDAVVVARYLRNGSDIRELVGGVAIDREIDAFEMRAEEQVVAIARSCEHVLRRDLPAGAGAVLDHDALPEPLAQALGDVARRQIGRPARGETDHEAYRLVRILRVRDGRGEDLYDGQNQSASGHRTLITTPEPSSRSSASARPPWNSAISRTI